MQIGIFAKTFAGSDPNTVLAAAAAAGFDGVQYNMACSGLAPMPSRMEQAQAMAVADAARAVQIDIFALSGTWNMAHPDPLRRSDGLARLAVLAAHARAMGTRLITLCTGTRHASDQWAFHPDNRSPQAWRDMVASMEAAIAIADTHDVDLGIEPELANIVDGAVAARRLIDELGSGRLRIVLDPANLFEQADAGERRRIIETAVDLLADRIVMAHAKDRDAAGGFATAGIGVIDFDHFLGALARTGFSGPVVAHGLAAAEAPGVAAFLRRQIEAVV